MKTEQAKTEQAMARSESPPPAEQRSVHPWEAAGLGKAPFRWLGVTIEVGPRDISTDADRAAGVRVEVGAPGQPMGSCKYCGQGIKEVHHIKSADGKRFTVGCDCVRRVNAKGSKVLTDAERASRAIARKARHASEAAKVAEGRAWLGQPEVAAALAALPHPAPIRAARGETMLSMVDWYLTHAGMSGKLAVIRQARKALAGVDGRDRS